MVIDGCDKAVRAATVEHAAPVTPARPLRLLAVCSGAYPPDFGGGPLTVHKTVVRMRDRFQVVAEALALSGPTQGPGWSCTDGIPVRRLSETTGALAFAITIGRHLFRARRNAVDLVYVIHTGRVVYLTALWARLLGLPLFVEITNCNLNDKASRRLVAGWLLRDASLTVAISEPVAREIRSFGIPAERIWVRPNPVDVELFRLPSFAERSAKRHQLGYDKDSVLHLVAGIIQDRKNQILAVDVIEGLGAEHRLLIVGPVLPEFASYADQLKAKAAASPARDRIRILEGFTDELPQIMQAADCLWMPSKEEGLGNVMVEALCCGVPCIINEGLGMDEHVINGVNGWQAPLKAEAWIDAVDAVKPLIEDFERHHAISATARSRYDAARFDIEFYRRLLQCTARGSVRPDAPQAST